MQTPRGCVAFSCWGQEGIRVGWVEDCVEELKEPCFLLPGDEHHEGCPGGNGAFAAICFWSSFAWTADSFTIAYEVSDIAFG